MGRVSRSSRIPSSPLPSDVHFDDAANAFSFKAEIDGKLVQCFITSPTVEALLGPRATIKSTIVSIKRSCLAAIASKLSERKRLGPIWITLEVMTEVELPAVSFYAPGQLQRY